MHTVRPHRIPFHQKRCIHLPVTVIPHHMHKRFPGRKQRKRHPPRVLRIHSHAVLNPRRPRLIHHIRHHIRKRPSHLHRRPRLRHTPHPYCILPIYKRCISSQNRRSPVPPRFRTQQIGRRHIQKLPFRHIIIVKSPRRRPVQEKLRGVRVDGIAVHRPHKGRNRRRLKANHLSLRRRHLKHHRMRNLHKRIPILPGHHRIQRIRQPHIRTAGAVDMLMKFVRVPGTAPHGCLSATHHQRNDLIRKWERSIRRHQRPVPRIDLPAVVIPPVVERTRHKTSHRILPRRVAKQHIDCSLPCRHLTCTHQTQHNPHHQTHHQCHPPLQFPPHAYSHPQIHPQTHPQPQLLFSTPSPSSP